MDQVIGKVQPLDLLEVPHGIGKAAKEICGALELDQALTEPDGLGQCLELVILKVESREVRKLIQAT